MPDTPVDWPSTWRLPQQWETILLPDGTNGKVMTVEFDLQNDRIIIFCS